MLERMDEAKYAEHWMIESELFGRQGVYDKLSVITPQRKVLEIGAGTGLSTAALAVNHDVLAIDSNAFLLEQVRGRVASLDNVRILGTDFLTPAPQAVQCIQEFAPDVIVGWFLGSNVDDQERHVTGNVGIMDLAKKYREKIEDAILSAPLLQPSVQWVHFAFRGGRLTSASLEEAERAGAENYNQHVFHPNGFELVEIKTLDWDRDESEFMYVETGHPSNVGKEVIPTITSMLAQRRSR